MTQGTVGWLCSKCSTVISPYETACAKCAPVSGIRYGPGTVSIGGLSGTYTFGGMLSSGTIYAAHPKTDAQKLDEAKRKATKWQGRYESLFEQLQELVEQFTDDEDDE